MGPHTMMPRDIDAVKGARLARETAGRVWGFARPYRGTIVLFLTLILVAALLALVPPLVVRQILDHAIPDGDRAQIWLLAGLAVAAALDHYAIAYAQHRGRRGHPVGFGAELYSELVKLSGDEGARRLIARYPAHGVEVDDPGVLIDVDTEADLEQLRLAHALG